MDKNKLAGSSLILYFPTAYLVGRFNDARMAYRCSGELRLAAAVIASGPQFKRGGRSQSQLSCAKMRFAGTGDAPDKIRCREV